jgi:Na+/H+ antiporter NhaD/arsenite permease-like protein
MKYVSLLLLSACLLLGQPLAAQTHLPGDSLSPPPTEAAALIHSEDSGHQSHDAHLPAPWSVAPFILLLLMIATGPIWFNAFWHHYYPWIAGGLGAVTLLYYLAGLGDWHHPLHTLSEYISFVALLAPLYIASGGVLIQVDARSTPWVNLLLLLAGAVLANVIGTTGASMLLIRPFIRLNRYRLQPYHIVFFIFIVSNAGGLLTPIGDPPLFLGFLKGVPFGWTLAHLWDEWILALLMLSAIFIWRDRRNTEGAELPDSLYDQRIILRGTRSFLWLAVIIAAVFLDPKLLPWVPALDIGGERISFLRELIQLGAGAAAYFLANKTALKSNQFSFAPVQEVVFLFVGIFFTMMPALQLIGEAASGPEGKAWLTPDVLYWLTGSLSAVLDNAPTYVNFLSASCAAVGLDVGVMRDVARFAGQEVASLAAISVASVFFGAMTYIGNGPNFMVKAIAEESGVEMPSFFAYVRKYSLPYLLPVLVIIWLIS